MPDKTRLELDIEHRERIRTPASVKILILLLAISLCFSGIYSFQLRQKLAKIEQESVVMKEHFSKEKVELLGQIRQLQAKLDSPIRDMNLRETILR
jgi:Tfp pilus assembly protein PilO